MLRFGAASGCGEIGIHAAFRSLWGQPRGGSSPLIRIAAGVAARPPTGWPGRLVETVREYELEHGPIPDDDLAAVDEAWPALSLDTGVLVAFERRESGAWAWIVAQPSATSPRS